MASTPNWRIVNRSNWNERVAIHLGDRGYDLAALRQGRGALGAIVEAELPPVAGKRILHLQCHFGADTLTLAQRGADMVGLDFSADAIAAARTLAAELGLTDRAVFVESDVYDARSAIARPAAFDLVYVTWGALCWLPDIALWASIVASCLRPGGSLYLAEAHPTAMVFDDEAAQPNGEPGFSMPYFHTDPMVFDDARDYADASARLTNSVTCQWIHPLGAVVTALIAAGLRLDWLHEHDAIAWQMFKCLVEAPGGLHRWPDRPWLPLAYSLLATKPA